MADTPGLGDIGDVKKRIEARRKELTPYFEYVDGKFPLPDASPDAQVNYNKLLDDAKLNICRVTVDVLSERARIQGWRPLGGNAGSEADDGAWRDWNRQRGDMFSRIAHRTAMTAKVAYAAVWDRSGDETRLSTDPVRLFTVEDPRDCIIEYADGDLRRRVWAAKLWAGGSRLTVVDRERLVVYHETRDSYGRSFWDADEESSGEHPFRAVPFVPLFNQPTLTSEGVSDVHDVMPVQRRINQVIWLRALATEINSTRQKWIANMALQQDKDGKPVPPPISATDMLWFLEAADGKELKTGEFGAADLRQFSQVIEGDLQHAAMITRIPRRYLMPTGQEPSGDALRSSESGLVAKVLERTDVWTESWAEVMTLIRGQDAPPVEPIWVDPEVYTLGEVIDAAVKKKALGVPDGQLYEDIGYEPSQVARFPAMRAQQQLEAMLYPTQNDQAQRELDRARNRMDGNVAAAANINGDAAPAGR